MAESANTGCTTTLANPAVGFFWNPSSRTPAMPRWPSPRLSTSSSTSRRRRSGPRCKEAAPGTRRGGGPGGAPRSAAVPEGLLQFAHLAVQPQGDERLSARLRLGAQPRVRLGLPHPWNGEPHLAALHPPLASEWPPLATGPLGRQSPAAVEKEGEGPVRRPRRPAVPDAQE